MRILITGVTGLLGSDCALLLKVRHELFGWARHRKLCPVSLEEVDVTDPKAVEEGLSRLRPDLVIHTAALTDVDGCERDPQLAFRMNRDPVVSVAKGCARVGAFLIAISTDYVFDGRKETPYREEDPTDPVNIYGKAKQEGEEAALTQTKRSIVVRVSALFGGARPNLVTEMVDNFSAHKPVFAVVDQRYSPSYTRDLAQAISRLLDHLEGAPRILHIANAQGASRYEVAQEVAKQMNAPASLIRPTSWVALGRIAARPRFSQLDFGRFTQLTGLALRPWQEALADFLLSYAGKTS